MLGCVCLQAAVEKMCRTFEDQLNESKNRANEFQRQLTEVSAQKARALSETGKKNTQTVIQTTIICFALFSLNDR